MESLLISCVSCGKLKLNVEYSKHISNNNVHRFFFKKLNNSIDFGADVERATMSQIELQVLQLLPSICCHPSGKGHHWR